jgi:hypothetical protein
MSTLVTERDHSLGGDDGQESLFGGEAFSRAPEPRAPWQRSGAGTAQAGGSAPLKQSGTFEAYVAAPSGDLFEAQPELEYESGPSAEDVAAYAAEAGVGAALLGTPVPVEAPARDAGMELAALERSTVSAARTRVPLAGPTLDDVMSRAWEGLASGMPAACPVCDGEVMASFAGSVHGSCSSCGTTIE